MDFVIIANTWAAGIANPTSKHRIALELAGRGHRVLWIEGTGMRTPSLAQRTDRARMVGKARALLAGVRNVAPNIWIVSPVILPFPRFGLARRINAGIYLSAARMGAGRLGFNQPVLVNFLPVIPEVVRRWRGRRVYYCVDRWDAFKMYDSAMMRAMDEQCCRHADVVIASSHDLYARCRRLNPETHLILHGVDHAHFARAVAGKPDRPADLPTGKLVGFFGLLSEWLDQDLIVKLALAIPECQIVLIGTADVPMDKLRVQPNIHLLGPRPFKDLPAYVAHFEVGIIPFVVNNLTRAVNPIKLREMLSAGCPVVSTDLPEVAALRLPPPLGSSGGASPRGDSPISGEGSGIWIANTPDEFVTMVRERLAHPMNDAERQAISATMAGETWATKVDEIMEIIEQGGRLKPET